MYSLDFRWQSQNIMSPLPLGLYCQTWHSGGSGWRAFTQKVVIWLFITFSLHVTWQNKNVISPLPHDILKHHPQHCGDLGWGVATHKVIWFLIMWPRNLVGWWLQISGSQLPSNMSFWSFGRMVLHGNLGIFYRLPKDLLATTDYKWRDLPHQVRWFFFDLVTWARKGELFYHLITRSCSK